MKIDCPVENSLPLPHIILSQFSLLLMMALPVIIHTGITGDVMKLVTCFKLVSEEQDTVVTPQRLLNSDQADAKISRFDLNVIGAATQLSVEGDEIVTLTVGGSLLQNSKMHKDVPFRGPDSLFIMQDPQLEHLLPRSTAQALVCAAKNTELGLMLLGKGSGDTYAQQIGLLVGELLQLPAINAVSNIQYNGDRTTIGHTLEDEVEAIELSLPAMLCITSDINIPCIPSMKAILGAGKKPVIPWQASDIDWTPASPLAEPVSLTVLPQTGRKHTILENDSAEAIAEPAEHLRKALS